MRYRVTFVADEDLPTETPWVIVPRTPDDLGPFLFVKRSCVTPEILSEAWQAWRMYVTGQPRLLPVPRRTTGDHSIAKCLPAASNA